jgi:hypothetical protein
MRPGDVLPNIITVEAADGTPVTGLTLAAFTTQALGRGYGASAFSAYAASFALTERGGGEYQLDFALPPSAGHVDVRIAPTVATRIVSPNRWRGEVEQQDLDSIFANVVRGVALPTQGATLGLPYPGELVAYRQNPWTIPVNDSAGNPIDLSSPAFNNLRLSVRSKDQTTVKLDATPGSPSGFGLVGTLGFLTITWPEATGSGIADIYAWLATGDLTKDPLYYEVVGDADSDTAKTRPIIRSSELRITRREVGS